MKHTPGPWKILPRTNKSFYIQPNICDHVKTKNNADLIAAAPDLLEACKHFVDACERKIMSNRNIISFGLGEMKQAIAKAEPK